MLRMLSGPLPVLVSVIDCSALIVSMVWLPNVSDVGARETAGAPEPVPVSATLCDPPAALSTSVMLPVWVPVVVGVNVTVMLQAPPAATDDPQLLVCA